MLHVVKQSGNFILMPFWASSLLHFHIFNKSDIIDTLLRKQKDFLLKLIIGGWVGSFEFVTSVTGGGWMSRSARIGVTYYVTPPSVVFYCVSSLRSRMSY